MEKHITLVGILNIVYRSLAIIGALVLIVIAACFRYFINVLVCWDSITPPQVPIEILDIVPLILVPIAIIILVVSIVGIIGAIGILKRKSWARIVLLIISFFNLMRIPLGTALGVYTIWVLMNDETIRLFSSVSNNPQMKTST
ncbi:MAG: hypothetical protein HY800_02720 [Ignavibacteriales bacterium]|nr:hypothetical protein [Ignavibacteriales bacterium]